MDINRKSRPRKLLSWTITCFILLLQPYDLLANNCSVKSGDSCDACTADFNCFYCSETKLCGKRPVIKPRLEECDGQWYSYGQCQVSGNLLLIIVPCVMGFLLVMLGCCIYCCCCRKWCQTRARRRLDREQAKRETDREEREMKHAERRAERAKKHEEIRNKYGLFKDGDKEDGKYHRFDVA